MRHLALLLGLFLFVAVLNGTHRTTGTAAMPDWQVGSLSTLALEPATRAAPVPVPALDPPSGDPWALHHAIPAVCAVGTPLPRQGTFPLADKAGQQGIFARAPPAQA